MGSGLKYLKSSIISTPFWVAGILLLSGADGCHGISKKAGAPEAVSTEDGGDSSASSCPGFATYVASAEPALQARCIGCHTSGQSGGNKYALTSGTFTAADAQAVSNYVSSKTKLLSSDGGNLDSNPILERPLGTNHQQIFFDLEDPYYTAIYDWVYAERTEPCE